MKNKRKKLRILKVAEVGVLCLALLGSTAMASARTDVNQTDAAAGVVNTSDGRMIISEAGEYTLTGNMTGTVYVAPDAGDVTLILDGVSIDGAGAPAIVAVSGDSLTIRSEDGSVNSITGGADEEHDAAIYSVVDLAFEGEGILNVANGSQNGIRAFESDIDFNSGEYRITAGGNGLAANQINLNGGVVYVNAGGSAVDPSSVLVRNGGELYENQNVTTAVESAVVTSSTVYYGIQDAAQTTASGVVQSDTAYTNEMPTGDMPTGEMPTGDIPTGEMPTGEMPTGEMPTGDMPTGDMPTGTMPGAMTTVTSTTDTAGEVVEGMTSNSAMDLETNYETATTYNVSDESTVTISESGTYIVTGSSSDGSITVTKGTTGVVLVLQDLDLTSTSSATLSINKNAEVKVIVSGNVTLTDAENPEDENSEDEEVAEAFDGTAIKVKANSVVVITGDGTLTVNGNAKNGIKAGDDSSLIIDGEDLTVNITAENDGINSNYDVAILSGDVTIAAGDDAIHADHILTIGDEETGEGPDLTITESTEGIEATVINIYGGDIDITSSDDAINAANGDGVYEGELDYSYNQMGGDVTINATGDGIDSNGNVNLIGGSATISSGAAGGEAGIDYVGDLYVSEDYELNNPNGTANDAMMSGDMASGEMGAMPGTTGEMGTMPGAQNGQTGMPGAQNGMGMMPGASGEMNG